MFLVLSLVPWISRISTLDRTLKWWISGQRAKHLLVWAEDRSSSQRRRVSIDDATRPLRPREHQKCDLRLLLAQLGTNHKQKQQTKQQNKKQGQPAGHAPELQETASFRDGGR